MPGDVDEEHPGARRSSRFLDKFSGNARWSRRAAWSPVHKVGGRLDAPIA